MNVAVASLLLSIVALAVSGLAAWYARQQAHASQDQAIETRRASDIAEAASRHERQGDLERLVREHLSLEFDGDGVRFEATLKSSFHEALGPIVVATLPVKTPASVGFAPDDPLVLVSEWVLPSLEPGGSAQAVMADLRPNDYSPVDVRFTVGVGGFTCVWTVPVQLPYPPTLSFY